MLHCFSLCYFLCVCFACCVACVSVRIYALCSYALALHVFQINNSVCACNEFNLLYVYMLIQNKCRTLKTILHFLLKCHVAVTIAFCADCAACPFLSLVSIWCRPKIIFRNIFPQSSKTSGIWPEYDRNMIFCSFGQQKVEKPTMGNSKETRGNTQKT